MQQHTPPRQVHGQANGSVMDDVWTLLLQISFHHVFRHFAHVVAEFELSPPQAHLLLQLGSGRTMSQRELARLLECDPSNLTGLTDRLEARGLVERQVDPDDRRVKALVATEKGEAVRTQLAARLHQAPEGIGELPAADAAQLRDLLARLIPADAL